MGRLQQKESSLFKHMFDKHDVLEEGRLFLWSSLFKHMFDKHVLEEGRLCLWKQCLHAVITRSF